MENAAKRTEMITHALAQRQPDHVRSHRQDEGPAAGFRAEILGAGMRAIISSPFREALNSAFVAINRVVWLYSVNP